ncbi:MAG: hypothetical protein DRP64_09940 [Verrucomicrobia bacterium]|nr:MAG: hypothetical protein DRP64_09940 [Verrucomicrobiota bacterium]
METAGFAAKSGSSEKLSLLSRAAYGCGGTAEVVMANLVIILALPIFNLGLGIDAGLIGLALFIQKFWDAISDPLMGNISDNTRSRWGRRKPYIFFGAILTGIFCMVMWMPPIGVSDKTLIIYFILATLLYYTSYTVFFVPYNALGFEMTSNYDERTKLMGTKVMFMNFGALAFLSIALKLCFTLGRGDEVKGVRYVGVIYGVIIIAFGVIPALFCKERVMTGKQEKTPLSKALGMTLSNKPFMILCGVIFTMLSAAMIGGPLMNYMNIAYTLNNEKTRIEYRQELPVLLEAADEEFLSIKKNDPAYTYRRFADSKAIDSEAGFNEFARQRGETYSVYFSYIKNKASSYMLFGMLIYGVMGIVCVPGITALGVRFGKRRTLMGSIVLAGVAYGMSWFYITPSLPWLHLIERALAAPAFASVFIFTYAMTADICDVDELESGKRREGAFGAIYSLLMKLSASIAISLSALVVKWVAFDSAAALQSADTILKMRLFFAFGPLALLAVALVLTFKFPITRKKMEEVQALLAERKSAQQLEV